MRKMTQKSTGFTLIELMVVVVILVIIAAVSVSIYSTFTVKSRWSEVQPCLSKAAINLENYRQNHGVYPAADIWTAINAQRECGDYYVGEINVFNGGQSYAITFMDSKKSISGKSIRDSWVITDVSSKILHVSNPLDAADVDTPPSGYGAHIPSNISP